MYSFPKRLNIIGLGLKGGGIYSDTPDSSDSSGSSSSDSGSSAADSGPSSDSGASSSGSGASSSGSSSDSSPSSSSSVGASSSSPASHDTSSSHDTSTGSHDSSAGSHDTATSLSGHHSSSTGDSHSASTADTSSTPSMSSTSDKSTSMTHAGSDSSAPATSMHEATQHHVSDTAAEGKGSSSVFHAESSHERDVHIHEKDTSSLSGGHTEFEGKIRDISHEAKSDTGLQGAGLKGGNPYSNFGPSAGAFGFGLRGGSEMPKDKATVSENTEKIAADKSDKPAAHVCGEGGEGIYHMTEDQLRFAKEKVDLRPHPHMELDKNIGETADDAKADTTHTTSGLKGGNPYSNFGNSQRSSGFGLRGGSDTPSETTRSSTSAATTDKTAANKIDKPAAHVCGEAGEGIYHMTEDQLRFAKEKVDIRPHPHMELDKNVGETADDAKTETAQTTGGLKGGNPYSNFGTPGHRASGFGLRGGSDQPSDSSKASTAADKNEKPAAHVCGEGGEGIYHMTEDQLRFAKEKVDLRPHPHMGLDKNIGDSDDAKADTTKASGGLKGGSDTLSAHFSAFGAVRGGVRGGLKGGSDQERKTPAEVAKPGRHEAHICGTGVGPYYHMDEEDLGRRKEKIGVVEHPHMQAPSEVEGKAIAPPDTDRSKPSKGFVVESPAEGASGTQSGAVAAPHAAAKAPAGASSQSAAAQFHPPHMAMQSDVPAQGEHAHHQHIDTGASTTSVSRASLNAITGDIGDTFFDTGIGKPQGAALNEDVAECSMSAARVAGEDVGVDTESLHKTGEETGTTAPGTTITGDIVKDRAPQDRPIGAEGQRLEVEDRSDVRGFDPDQRKMPQPHFSSRRDAQRAEAEGGGVDVGVRWDAQTKSTRGEGRTRDDSYIA